MSKLVDISLVQTVDMSRQEAGQDFEGVMAAIGMRA